MPGMQPAMAGNYAKEKLPGEDPEELASMPSVGGGDAEEPAAQQVLPANNDRVSMRDEMFSAFGNAPFGESSAGGSAGGGADTGSGPVEVDWSQVGQDPLQQAPLPTTYGSGEYGEELQQALGQTFQGVGARDPASLEGASWQAAGGPAAATASAGQAGALGSEYFDPASVEGVPATYAAGSVEETMYRDPVTGESLIAADVRGPGPVGTGTVDAVSGPTAADILMEGSPEGRDAQLSGLEQLRLLAGGDESRALQLQRERGLREQLAMMASQRGVPAAAVLRAGAQMQEGREREIAQAAAQQQMQAIGQVGQQAGALRGQDIGLATDQARLEQEAAMAGAEMEQQRALAEGQFEQESAITQSELDAQARAQESAQIQQANLAGFQAETDRKTTEGQMRHDAIMGQQAEEAAARQADAAFMQEMNLSEAELETTRRLENAGLSTQAAIETARLQQEANNIAAQFQQEANLSNAEMEQQRQIAEAQINADLEQQRDSMLASLLNMGFDFETANRQVDAQLEMARQESMYKYFAAQLGARVEVGTTLIDKGHAFEGSTEQLQEEMAVLSMLAGGAGTGMAKDAWTGGAMDVSFNKSGGFGGFNTNAPPKDGEGPGGDDSAEMTDEEWREWAGGE